MLSLLTASSSSWLRWSSWSECTFSCGGGEKLRTRMCDQGPENEECVGDARQIVECGTAPCPGKTE